MSDLSKDFREARERYGPLLIRALTYFLEDESAATRVASSALEQAARQWTALEGETNTLHLIGIAAADQCSLLLPRSIFVKRKPNPTATQIVRHLEWYDWEQRIESIRNEIDVKRASARESGVPTLSDAELASIERHLDEVIQALFRSQLGLTGEDDNTAGGIACEIPPPKPTWGPGERRDFADALAAPRNP